MTTMLERYEGCLLGLAVGDALGGPTEFMSYDEIRRRWPPTGLTSFQPFRGLPAGSYTDDTEMTIAVARGLVEASDLGSDSILTSVANQFVQWLSSTSPARSPGVTCTAGVRELARGVHWSKSGNNNSNGCGSAMRSAPIGLAFRHSIDSLLFYTSRISRMTHGGDVATAGSVATAYMVARSLDGTDPPDILDDLILYTTAYSEDFGAHLTSVYRAVQMGASGDAHSFLGEGWTAEEAVAGAVFANILYPDSFRDIVLEAANSGGDCDSKACIAGAIAGARLGRQAIPGAWADTVEGRDELIRLARELLRMQERLARL